MDKRQAILTDYFLGGVLLPGLIDPILSSLSGVMLFGCSIDLSMSFTAFGGISAAGSELLISVTVAGQGMLG